MKNITKKYPDFNVNEVQPIYEIEGSIYWMEESYYPIRDELLQLQIGYILENAFYEIIEPLSIKYLFKYKFTVEMNRLFINGRWDIDFYLSFYKIQDIPSIEIEIANLLKSRFLNHKFKFNTFYANRDYEKSELLSADSYNFEYYMFGVKSPIIVHNDEKGQRHTHKLKKIQKVMETRMRMI